MSDFQQMIQEDRSCQEIRTWKGKFLDYLELVKKNPDIAKLSHARLYDAILRAGVSDIKDSEDVPGKRIYKDESFKIYEFFTHEFFGIEKVIAKIARYFHS